MISIENSAINAVRAMRIPLDKTRNCSSAFTLMEIMIIVIIVGILAILIVPNLLRTRASANDAIAQATLKAISGSLENYMSIHTEYPTDTDLLLGATPPYLNKDYFNGTHAGFSYLSTLEEYSYTVEAIPVIYGQTGSTSYTLTTGGVITEGN